MLLSVLILPCLLNHCQCSGYISHWTCVMCFFVKGAALLARAVVGPLPGHGQGSTHGAGQQRRSLHKSIWTVKDYCCSIGGSSCRWCCSGYSIRGCSYCGGFSW